MSEVIAPVEAPVTPAPAAAVTPAQPDQLDPAWLPARLEQAKRSLLKELGVESEADAKKAIADAKAKEDAAKSETEKTAELISSLKAKAAKADALEAAVKTQADAALAALDEAKRNAVTALTGGDPAKVIGAIAALQPTWVSAAPVPAPAPADTLPAPGAPADTDTSPPDVKAQYEELKEKNPFLAYSFYREHASELFKS